jgi:hypothetical protein
MNDAFKTLRAYFPRSVQTPDVARDWLHARLVYDPMGKIEDGIEILHAKGMTAYVLEWERYKANVGHDRTTYWTSLFAPNLDWGTYEQEHNVIAVGQLKAALPLLSSLKEVNWIYTKEMAEVLGQFDALASRRVKFLQELKCQSDELDLLLAMEGRFFAQRATDGAIRMSPPYQQAMSRLTRMVYVMASQVTEKRATYGFVDSISLWGLIFRETKPPTVPTTDGKEAKEAKAASPKIASLVDVQTDLETLGNFISIVLPSEWAEFRSMLARLHLRKAGAISDINDKTVQSLVAEASSTTVEAEALSKKMGEDGDKIAGMLALLFQTAGSTLARRAMSAMQRKTKLEAATRDVWKCIAKDEKVAALFNRIVTTEFVLKLDKDFQEALTAVDKKANTKAIYVRVGRNPRCCEKTACRFLDLLTFRAFARSLGTL